MKRVIVGRVGKTFGIKGFVKIISYTKPFENIMTYKPWMIQKQNTWQVIEIEEEIISAQGIKVRFKDCHDREQANQLVNCEIAINQSQLADLPSGEYYWSELEGLSVVNTEGCTLGVVDHLIETGANDVLVVTGERKTLIPFIKPDIIKSIDLVKKIIVVDWEKDF